MVTDLKRGYMVKSCSWAAIASQSRPKLSTVVGKSGFPAPPSSSIDACLPLLYTMWWWIGFQRLVVWLRGVVVVWLRGCACPAHLCCAHHTSLWPGRDSVWRWRKHRIWEMTRCFEWFSLKSVTVWMVDCSDEIFSPAHHTPRLVSHPPTGHSVVPFIKSKR